VTTRTLGVSLRFWPDPASGAWTQTLDAIWSWESRLRPRSYQVMNGPGADRRGDIPWDANTTETLSNLCANLEQFSWVLAGDDWYILDCKALEGRVVIDIRQPATNAPADRWLDLFARIPAAHLPGFVLGFDADKELEIPNQGMRKLRHLSSIVGLHARAIEQLGGGEHVRASPCDVHPLPGDGLLLVINPDLFVHTKSARARVAAEATHLKISEETPLMLIP
jgi:hypothetical protein